MGFPTFLLYLIEICRLLRSAERRCKRGAEGEEDEIDIRGRVLRRDSSLALRMTNKPTVLTVGAITPNARHLRM